MLHKLSKSHTLFFALCFLFCSFTNSTLALPVIQITSPTNGSTYIEGDTVQLFSGLSGATSNARVEFYINNVYIGSDSTAPYQFTWISSAGTHLLSTKAVFGLCNDVTSVPVQIVVKKNTPPVVQLTAPLPSNPYFSNLPVHLAATAADSDGVVRHVDFYMNDIFIGRDETTPYEFNWKSNPGSYTINAKVTDDKGSQSLSAPVAIQVYPPVNSPPVITILSPQSGDHFFLGSPVPVKASATDSDGYIAFVEFFVNNISIGIDDTAPYEISWTGGIGVHTITAKATDDLCVSSFSDTIPISVIDPNAPPYIICTLSGPCTDPTFCIPLSAVLPVKDIIGFDLVLHYDKTKVKPTGNITISNDLINAGAVSFVSNVIDSLSELHLSVFLNNSAPPTTAFKGIGKVLCVEFLKKSSFIANDSALFSITGLQESYANGVLAKNSTPGSYHNLKNTLYKGVLQFWTDNSPIKYDVSSPSHYLPTNIYGNDANCSNLSLTAVQPDLNGKFVHPISNGTSIQIKRDILPTTDVQPVINGMDVSMGYAVLLNDASFAPTIYQAIALDVNMDGVISAGDLSQMNQRSIKTILEFKQKWNYNNNGSSNGQLSKDWIFLDEALLAKPAYKISFTYPANDGIGFSKHKVPVVPFCLPVPSSVCSSCTPYAEGKLKGVLLGDVNGNYDAISPDGQIKRPNAEIGTIYLDMAQAKQSKNYLDIPVFFTSTEKIVALDLSIKLPKYIHYSKLTQHAEYINDALAHVDDDQILRFTSNGRKPYMIDKPVVYIRFSTSDDHFDPQDLQELTGYLNGELVPFEIHTDQTTRINNPVENTTVSVYPNPANGILNVQTDQNGTVQLLDIQGKEVLLERSIHRNRKLELQTGQLKPGVYILKIFNDEFVRTEQIVIERK